MAVLPEIARLIQTFERNRESYRQGHYSETQLRREYIDPSFKALGWDADNTRGYAEPYKDVIHEDAIRIGTAWREMLEIPFGRACRGGDVSLE